MGLFDFFKKKKTEQLVQQKPAQPESNYGVIGTSTHTVQTKGGAVGVNVTISVPKDGKKDKGTFVKNGLTYHVTETTSNGCTFSESIPEYNEVYVFYTFLQKYPTIKKPELVRECDYAHWMFARIGIEVVGKVHKDLYEKGFYCKAPNRNILSTMKVGEIKAVIEKLGLNIKGKKEDLIDDLISQVDEDTLASMLDQSVCTISAFGKQWMKEHELEYDWYSADEEFPTFDDYKRKRGGKSKDELLREQCIHEIQTDKRQFGRYAYDTLISFLEREGNMREVVVCYLRELLIDMSGAMCYDDWKRVDFDKEIIRECSDIMFTPFLLQTFPKYKAYYVPEMINEAYALKLPINACSIDDFRDIAEMMFDGTMDETTQKQYQSRLERKLVQIGLSLR